jgi:hypothetical protein
VATSTSIEGYSQQIARGAVFPPTRSGVKPPRRDEYANSVIVERGEHDAVLRFTRERGGTGTCVAEIIVPLGVLDALKEA